MRLRLGVEHAFLVVGLAMLVGAWFAYDLTVRRPRTWPQTDALVVSSRVANPGGPQQYSPEIVFRYEAAGERREVAIVPSWSSGSYDLVRGHVDRYPAGATVRVAVNPANPADIRYDLSSSLTNLLLPGVLAVMGLLFGGIGAGVMAANRRKTTSLLTPSVLEDTSGNAIVSRTAQRVAFAFLAIGLIIGVIGIALFRSDVTTLRDWPEIDATVVESHIVSVSSTSTRGTGSRSLYDVQVTFRYVVGDRTYQSATTYGIASSNQSSARDMMNEYAPGSVHVIRYRPGDPNIIRFDMDSYVSVFLMSVAMLAMGLVFVSVGVLMFWSFRRDQARAAADATADDADADLTPEDRFRPRP